MLCCVTQSVNGKVILWRLELLTGRAAAVLLPGKFPCG